jgi:multiple sugar transport system permease protein
MLRINKKGLIFKHGWFGTSVSYLYLVLLSLVAVFPLIWIVSSAFKGRGELASGALSLLPKQPTFEYFVRVLTTLGFSRNIFNSLSISLTATLIAIAISSLAAHGIVRYFPQIGKKLTRVLITTYMFPPTLLVIPYAIIFSRIHLSNSRIGLVVTYLSFSIPYAVWLLVGFFQTVPKEVEEAAFVDGASRFMIFYRISLPIVAPGVVATAIYTFINAWNEFLYSLILINSTGKMTVSVALQSLNGAEILDWGEMMAASTLVILPSIVFFLIIQKRIASGISQGSIK